MFIQCLLCARDPVGNEVVILPASQCNRRLCSHKGRNPWSKGSVQGSCFSSRQLSLVSKAAKGQAWVPSVPCSLVSSQSHAHKDMNLEAQNS